METNDPLAGFVCDLPAVETTRPTLPKGDYVVDVTNVEPVYAQNDDKTAEDPRRPMWKLTYSTVNPAQAMPNKRGESSTISPGYQLFENAIMYQPEQKEGKKPAPDYKVRVARIYDACFGTDDTNRPSNYGDLRPCIGKRVVVSVDVREYQGRLTNDVKNIKEAPAGA